MSTTGVRRDTSSPVLIGAVLAAATLTVALVDPHDGGYPLCPLLALTGWYCPACGGLRTAHDLATGDLAAAWSTNPLLAVALPLLAVAWAVWTYRALRGRPARNPPGWLWAVVLGVLLTYGVLRNVPALQPYLGPSWP